jgi:beige protein homolog 1
LWDFVGGVIEFLDTPEIAKQKLVRSSDSYINSLRRVFNRLALFQLSELEDSDAAEDITIALLDRILFWQKALFSAANQDTEFIRMFCYHLYIFLFDTRRRVRLVASNVWRLMQLNKTEEVTNVLNFGKSMEGFQVSAGFLGIMETVTSS